MAEHVLDEANRRDLNEANRRDLNEANRLLQEITTYHGLCDCELCRARELTDVQEVSEEADIVIEDVVFAE